MPHVKDGPPAPGTTDLLEWTWTTVPSSPVTFTYTLNVPPSATGKPNSFVTVAMSEFE